MISQISLKKYKHAFRQQAILHLGLIIFFKCKNNSDNSPYLKPNNGVLKRQAVKAT